MTATPNPNGNRTCMNCGHVEWLHNSATYCRAGVGEASRPCTCTEWKPEPELDERTIESLIRRAHGEQEREVEEWLADELRCLRTRQEAANDA